MNDRLKVFGLALLCLLIVVVLLSPRLQPEIEYSKPSTVDRGDYGLLGLKNWLDHSGINSFSLRSRYRVLHSRFPLTTGGHLLITSIPHGVPVRDRELEQLSDWIAQGNTLVLLAAEQDQALWSFSALGHFGRLDGEKVLKHFGFEFKTVFHDDQSDAEKGDADASTGDEPSKNDVDVADTMQAVWQQQRDKRETVKLTSTGHPLLAGINSVSTRAVPGFAVHSLVATDDRRFAVPLLVTAADAVPAFWEASYGEGKLWISAYPDLFGNLTLGEGGNARFLERLIKASVGPDGYVIFDDFHFGLSEMYDPAAFFSDHRLHMSLLFILGFWFVYVLGHVKRLAPAVTAPRLPGESDFVQALAGLCARRIRPNAVAKGLVGHFFNEIRRKHRLPENGKPAWDLLQLHSRVTESDVKKLKQMVNDINEDRLAGLNRLSRLLNTIGNAL